jgi:hypothetical protein
LKTETEVLTFTCNVHNAALPGEAVVSKASVTTVLPGLSSNNNASNLNGCSLVGGTLKVAWTGKYYPDYPTLTPADSFTVSTSEFNPNSIFGSQILGPTILPPGVSSSGWGGFTIGDAAYNNTQPGSPWATPCVPPTGSNVPADEAFQGSDSGASTVAFVMTSNDIDTILGWTILDDAISPTSPPPNTLAIGTGSIFAG